MLRGPGISVHPKGPEGSKPCQPKRRAHGSAAFCVIRTSTCRTLPAFRMNAAKTPGGILRAPSPRRDVAAAAANVPLRSLRRPAHRARLFCLSPEFDRGLIQTLNPTKLAVNHGVTPVSS